MNNILDRYIGQSIISGVFIVLLIFIALYELFAFVGETGKIGRADYTVWTAIQYSLLLVPQHIYEMFPLSLLLGTMLGLGWLANHNELVVIRMAGVSLLRIVFSVMKTALLLIFLAMVIGEGIAPPLYQYAGELRVKALQQHINLNTAYGLWARDGNVYINVNRVENNGRLVGITLYEFEQEQLKRLIEARKATYDGKQWYLHKVKETIYSTGNIRIEEKEAMPWKTLLDLDMVKIVALPPELLSIWRLKGYIRYLKNNELNYDYYELIYWTKLYLPLTMFTMVLLAIPFVFGSVRQVSIGKQVMLGFLLGITFYMLNRLSGQMGLIYGIPPAISALLPTLVVISFTLWRYRKIR